MQTLLHSYLISFCKIVGHTLYSVYTSFGYYITHPVSQPSHNMPVILRRGTPLWPFYCFINLSLNRDTSIFMNSDTDAVEKVIF